MPIWRPYIWRSGDTAGVLPANLRTLEGVWSPQLRNRRDLVVWLPPSYFRGTRRFPVVYMQDAQNLFDPATSFAGDWNLSQVMYDAAAAGLDAIVVGVPHMGHGRIEEYSPFEDPVRGRGLGDAYVRFLADTVKPLVDDDLRTLPGPAHTAVAGSSMGGLISLYAGLVRPDVFGAAGVLSPSLWYADRAIFDFVERRSRVPVRLYVDVGTDEGEATLDDVRYLRDVLVQQGYEDGRDLMYVEEEGARHHEAAWGRRLREALPFLLAGPEGGARVAS